MGSRRRGSLGKRRSVEGEVVVERVIVAVLLLELFEVVVMRRGRGRVG